MSGQEVPKKLLIIRPMISIDDWTSKFSFDASIDIKGRAEDEGWQVTELQKNDANRTEVEEQIKKENPDLVIHYGHGWIDKLMGQRNDGKESVLSSALGEENVDLLSWALVSTVSCLSAFQFGLGERAINANKRNKKDYLGYDITIYCDYGYTAYFSRAANAANYALLEGKTFQEAQDIGYKQYTAEINKLVALNDPYVQTFVAPLMAINREHLKYLRDGSARATAGETIENKKPTFAARVPSLGNSIIVQYYFRKFRDKLFSRKMHDKLHPLI